MNTPSDIPDHSSNTTAVTQFENCVRKNPGGTLLFAAGIGLAAVLIARMLTPAPPRNRAMCLLEDIQQHLADLAKESSKAVNKGADNLVGLHLDRTLDKVSRKFKTMFH
ncbi:hypothetical protein [Prosthecobacter sp.]|uniref:hypothetical protein n=1 Tax=Prosthecobacter sp. TaxID=1965333 RepID=UPI0024874A82|nr:hypothetical protein [Prosthecobacter sp.]MDI1311083.1 hypothetical protein [Prosthecobacter sp.]